MSRLKVLIVTDTLDRGGMEMAAVRFGQALDSEKFECVFSVRSEKKGAMEDVLAQRGIRIIHQPDSELNYFKSYKYYDRLFKNEHFDIVHSHQMFYSGIVLKAAYKNNIKKRIAHSHFSKPLTQGRSAAKRFIALLYRIVMRKIIRKYATDIIGCSVESGIFLSGKVFLKHKGIVLNNVVDTSLYDFSSKQRNDIREEFNISDKTVLGHIGHFNHIKNQSFLIDIFNEFHRNNKSSVLLLVGSGEDEAMLGEKVERLTLDDSVIFAGVRDDVWRMLLAMDCMVFPSLHEGFPLTLIEAQSSKLPCVVSSRITPAVKLNDNLSFVSLESPPSVWCAEIENALKCDRESVDRSRVVEEYDIKAIGGKLAKIYTSLR